MTRLPIEAVIFDMDGLLVDSEPYWRKVEIAEFDALGFDVRPAIGKGLGMGRRVDEAVQLFCSLIGAPEEIAVELAEAVVRGVIDAIRTEAELLPGAREAITFARSRGLSVALASGSTLPVIAAVLERFSLGEAFEVVASAEDDEQGKPHPSIFLRTASALGVSPGSCVVLEDSLNGCEAARAAGMRVIAVPAPRDRADPRFSVADLVLSSLVEFDDSALAAISPTEASDRAG